MMNDQTAHMSPKVKEAFDLFTSLANKSGLHPLDWRRFYAFVRTAYACRSQIWEVEVKEALVEEGFDEEYARQLTQIYCHCWRMLSPFNDPTEARATRARWRRESKESRERSGM